MKEFIKRKDIFYCDLSGVLGSEQGGIRPCLILSNDIGNRFSPMVTICPITAQTKKNLVTHVHLDLKESSIALLEQMRSIDKGRLLYKLDAISEKDMKKVENALLASVGMFDLIQSDQELAYA